ncbi:NAD-dependent deacylase [Tessaracoccus sp. Y1736]
MNRQTVRQAWHVASHIVGSRPWLDISWVDPGDGGHLVVHDGPHGAALHFDDDQGPTWEPRSAPIREIDWDDVTESGSARLLGVTDWLECWGAPAEREQLTEKAAIYELIAHLQDDTENSWSARPAKLLLETDDDADATFSAFSLTKDFPSLATTVGWYVDQISGISWGEGSVWHEPLWLISRDGVPRVVLDEAGRVHLTFATLIEAIELLAAAADLGGIEDPHSFEILDALPRVGGSIAELARYLRLGPVDTLSVVKPEHSLTDPEPGTALGSGAPSTPTRTAFPTTSGGSHYLDGAAHPTHLIEEGAHPARTWEHPDPAPTEGQGTHRMEKRSPDTDKTPTLHPTRHSQSREGQRAAPAIVLLTGAGISAESGLSTFRDTNGLWRNHRIEEVASPHGFANNPELVHHFYDIRRRAALAAEPNAAHRALSLLEEIEGNNVLIITQNVDDLHERSGSTNVIHMHGELNNAWCTDCGTRHRWTADLADNPPCPTCGRQALRPDIVWFGEPVYRWEEIQKAADQCELFVVVGTSGTVSPAAGLAARARANGANTKLINLDEPNDPTGYDQVTLDTASVGVPQLVEQLFRDELAAFDDLLAELPTPLRHKWRSQIGSLRQKLRTTYTHEHRDSDWDWDYDGEPPELLLADAALQVKSSRRFRLELEALSLDDLARYEQQAKVEEQIRVKEHALEQTLAKQRDEHRAARLNRAGRLENLYISTEALADASFSVWSPESRDEVPGLLPGAWEAVSELHHLDYNVVLLAPEGMPLDGHAPTFWRWYVQYFGSDEGLWPDQLMMNWSRSKLQGWDLLVVAPKSHRELRTSGNGRQIIALGTPEFPNWNAMVTYLQNRD